MARLESTRPCGRSPQSCEGLEKSICRSRLSLFKSVTELGYSGSMTLTEANTFANTSRLGLQAAFSLLTSDFCVSTL
jgi:hypothetical protein